MMASKVVGETTDQDDTRMVTHAGQDDGQDDAGMRTEKLCSQKNFDLGRRMIPRHPGV